ncbi:MAG: hypothetical protein CL678_07585 [Bdellovibrionaceae bacterium]|nr:hypothetical protein [Pseudobdellovibrionaceae bacterium]
MAITFSRPEQFSDFQGMVACVALLVVAVALSSGVHRSLALNWAFALAPLVGTQHAISMQPRWTLALLTAAATLTAGKIVIGTRRVPLHSLKPLLMASIALLLPEKAIGIHATLLTRMVIGLGVCALVGVVPTFEGVLTATWAAVVLVRPIVIVATIATAGAAVVEAVTATVAVTAFATGLLARSTLQFV